MSDFISWEALLSYGGAVAVTGLITQFLKGLLDRVIHIPTQLLAYFVALACLLAACGFTGGLTAGAAGQCVLNAVLVATAASGSHAAITRVAMDGES